MAIQDFIDFGLGMTGAASNPLGVAPFIVDWMVKQFGKPQAIGSDASQQAEANVANAKNDFNPGSVIPFNNNQKMFQYLVGRLFSDQLGGKANVLKALPSIGAGVEGATAGSSILGDILGMTEGGSILKAILSLL